jgi:hypothetical protein
MSLQGLFPPLTEHKSRYMDHTRTGRTKKSLDRVRSLGSTPLRKQDHAATPRESLVRSISSSSVRKNIPMTGTLKRWNTSFELDLRGQCKDANAPTIVGTSTRHDIIKETRDAVERDSPALSGWAAHNSMHSLTPMHGDDTTAASSGGNTTKVDYQSRYQSELDDSDEDGCMWIPTVDNSAKTPVIHNMQEALNDIRDFQDQFVQRYNADVAKQTNGAKEGGSGVALNEAISVSRTQQKVLDYKDLQDYGQLDHIGSINHAAFDGATREGNSALDYNVKIQNETITSQYTLLRLRFNGGENSMGVLGFLKPGRRWPCAPPRGSMQVTKADKEQYLHEVWRTEMAAFARNSVAFSDASTAQSSPCATSTMGLSARPSSSCSGGSLHGAHADNKQV